MTKNDLIQKLLALKPILKKEGFTIVGIFGSYAREDYTTNSDIDILYTLVDPHQFSKKHGGFGAFTKIRETKEFLSREFGKDVDFVDSTSLSRTGKKYILKDLVSVS
jgi:predicted nucleotidyltransferase